MSPENQPTYEEAVVQIITSQHIDRLYRGEKLEALKSFLRQHPDCPIDLLPDEFFDCIVEKVCEDERNVSFKILFDSVEFGNWSWTVWGFAGVWVTWAPEFDHQLYSSRAAAVSYCKEWEEYSEDHTIRIEDHSIQPWQFDNE